VSETQLVNIGQDVWVTQVRAIWAGPDGQTRVRVDEHLTIAMGPEDINEVVRKWQEGRR